MSLPRLTSDSTPSVTLYGLHSNDIISAADRIQHRLMNSLPTNHKQPRLESSADVEHHNVTTCEVLGAKGCMICMEKLIKQSQYHSRFEERLCSYEDQVITKPTHISMILKLESLYPHLNKREIQERVMTDKTTTVSVTEEIKRRANIYKNSQAINLQFRLSDKNTNSLFFSDIDDLRVKIFRGKIPRTIRKSAREHYSLLDKINPPFRSTRQLSVDRKPVNDTLIYCPPLLPVHRQKTEAAFYAGKTGEAEYRLPDRLPVNEEYMRAIDSRPATSENPSI